MIKHLRTTLQYWKPFLAFFALQMIAFACFRVLFFLLNTSRLTEYWSRYQSSVYLFSFRFDLVITTYSLLLVWLIFSVLLVIKVSPKILFRILMGYFVLVNIVFLLLVCADLPYYMFFNERINPAVLLWMSTPEMMVKFVGESPEYYPFFALFFIALFTMLYFQRKYLRQWRDAAIPPSTTLKVSPLLLAAVLFICMRGGIQQRPLEVRDAFVTVNNYVNQFSLNPVFSYLNNYINRNTSYLSEADFASFLDSKKISVDKEFPLAAHVADSNSIKKWNVVLVLMESMTGNMMKQFGNTENITPFLDSLTGVSMNVKGHYSTGTHTCNGVYSSLYAFPSFMGVHPMSDPASVAQDFYGMPVVLKEKGYQNIFFTSHNRYWDNMQVFLTKNGIDTIYDINSHRHGTEVNALGMPDEVVFETALKKIDEHAAKGPVFASVLTISTHIPYTIPDFSPYKKLPQHPDPMKNVFRYADWSLKQFFVEAQKKPWFENTLFVFVADHGINLEPESDMPLSFHRSPLIFYKKDLPPQQLNKLASQTDIFPTVMGLMHQSYHNNVMGVDLSKESRPYAYFVGTNTIGCVDTSHFYIYRKFGDATLNTIGDPLQKDLSDQFPEKKKAMERYALGHLQLCAYILDHRKAGKPKP